MSSPRLFPAPELSLTTGLEALPEILKKVMPLKGKHRSSLPGAVRRLSAFLTVERENLPKGYMTRPEYQAAYLNYFLPWNIYRQGRLLQGLGLDIADGCRVIDLGAGPLTFLLALWLARPSLRTRALEYVGVDLAEPPLKAGRRIFEALGGQGWQVQTARRPAGGVGEPADLLVATNFLNELDSGHRGSRRHGLAHRHHVLREWHHHPPPDDLGKPPAPGSGGHLLLSGPCHCHLWHGRPE